MKKQISFILNNEKYIKEVDTNLTLLDFLRESAGIKSVKCGCDKGDCGTCTVLINDKTVRSCLVLAVEIDGETVTTLEGLMDKGLTPLQKAFLENNSFQCGFCTPGIILSATELLNENKKPEKKEIQEAIAGNLCRCTGYLPIIEAIQNLVKE